SALDAGGGFDFTSASQPHVDLDAAPQLKADAVFTFPEKIEIYSAGNIATSFDGSAPDVVLVPDDPFGRGVAESGGQLPLGAIDFGTTVRFYGVDYFGYTTT